MPPDDHNNYFDNADRADHGMSNGMAAPGVNSPPTPMDTSPPSDMAPVSSARVPIDIHSPPKSDGSVELSFGSHIGKLATRIDEQPEDRPAETTQHGNYQFERSPSDNAPVKQHTTDDGKPERAGGENPRRHMPVGGFFSDDDRYTGRVAAVFGLKPQPLMHNGLRKAAAERNASQVSEQDKPPCRAKKEKDSDPQNGIEMLNLSDNSVFPIGMCDGS